MVLVASRSAMCKKSVRSGTPRKSNHRGESGGGANTVDHWLGWAHSSHLRGWDSDITGYIASALVLATFSMKSMRSLRLTAVFSNVAFIAYAVSTDMRPILILHSVLLPVNIVRLAQIELERFGWRRSPARMPRTPRLSLPGSVQPSHQHDAEVHE